jgi:hypothetical protein
VDEYRDACLDGERDYDGVVPDELVVRRLVNVMNVLAADDAGDYASDHHCDDGRERFCNVIYRILGVVGAEADDQVVLALLRSPALYHSGDHVIMAAKLLAKVAAEMDDLEIDLLESTTVDGGDAKITSRVDQLMQFVETLPPLDQPGRTDPSPWDYLMAGVLMLVPEPQRRRIRDQFGVGASHIVLITRSVLIV